MSSLLVPNFQTIKNLYTADNEIISSLLTYMYKVRSMKKREKIMRETA